MFFICLLKYAYRRVWDIPADCLSHYRYKIYHKCKLSMFLIVFNSLYSQTLSRRVYSELVSLLHIYIQTFGWLFLSVLGELDVDLILAFLIVLSPLRVLFSVALSSVVNIYDQTLWDALLLLALTIAFHQRFHLVVHLLSSCYLGPNVCLGLCKGVFFGNRQFSAITC